MTTHKYQKHILKLCIVCLVFIQSIIASPFLVKDHHSIVLEKGKTFSINGEKQKYEFDSINFELELINNAIDLKHVNSITFYKGNKGRKLAKSAMISCVTFGFGAAAKSGEATELLVGVIAAIPFGTIAYFVGLLIYDEDNYIISDSEWRFVP